ncbi:MAG: S8 family serine peptidase [Clostridiaceae bacterium]|nr:S8 family serine peptidase [Clostridiaceae bacterium]
MSRNKPIRIAIVDDGVSEGLYSIGHLDFNIEIDQDLSVNTREDYNAYLPSHGTTCAAIIRKYAPDTWLGSVKILNDVSKRAMRDQFITAIEWCIENKVKLINLSLGTIVFSDFEDIRHFVNKAAANGLILVAACNNNNIYTLPACLTNAIGVKCRKLFIDEQYKFIPYPFDGIDIEASGRHMLTDTNGMKRYTRPANSFASPLVTAMVYKILAAKPQAVLEEIKEILYRNASNLQNDSYNPYICMNTDWFERKGGPEGCPEYLCKSVFESRKKAGKIWIEELYRKNIEKYINSKGYRRMQVDIPLIAVFDTGNCNILNRLSQFFSSRGYYSVKVSADYRDIVYGSEYSPDNIEIEEFISLVYKKHRCDVILLRINSFINFKYIEKNELFDIILFITEDGDYCYHKDTKKNLPLVLSFNRNDTDERLDYVFEAAFKLLGGTADTNENKA